MFQKPAQRAPHNWFEISMLFPLLFPNWKLDLFNIRSAKVSYLQWLFECFWLSHILVLML